MVSVAQRSSNERCVNPPKTGEKTKYPLQVTTPYFHSAIALPGNAARERVALFVLLILFVANTLCFLPSNNSPFCPRGGVTLCIWGEKKRHLVSWCAASVHTGFPEIPSLSLFQEDANFKIESMEGLSAIQRSLMFLEKAFTQTIVNPCLLCWYLFIHFKFDLKDCFLKISSGR